MNRKDLLKTGLSLLMGAAVVTVFPGVFPGVGTHSARAASVAQHVSRADEIQAPRWGEASGEQGEVEAPRGSDQTTDSDFQAPRWGDTSGEQGEVEAPRA